jgi:hypothetical protein
VWPHRHLDRLNIPHPTKKTHQRANGGENGQRWPILRGICGVYGNRWAKKVKGDKLERANMERSIETLAAGVEAVEKLRDAGEEAEVKRERYEVVSVL